MAFDPNRPSDLSGFAAILNSRIGYEARVTRAQGFAWLCGGITIASMLTGLGCAFAFWGYSHMQSVKPAAEQIAQAMTKALESSRLRTTVEGTMVLSPNAEVRLAPGQSVKLQEGSTVRLDPNSTVRVVGDLKIDVPQPSKQQLQIDTTDNRDELPFTSYTLFRSVNFGSGLVVTGWSYDLSDTAKPKIQYCYYSQNIERGLSAKYTIAINGSAQPPSALSKLSFNFDAAVANCIWFSGL